MSLRIRTRLLAIVDFSAENPIQHLLTSLMDVPVSLRAFFRANYTLPRLVPGPAFIMQRYVSVFGDFVVRKHGHDGRSQSAVFTFRVARVPLPTILGMSVSYPRLKVLNPGTYVVKQSGY